MKRLVFTSTDSGAGCIKAARIADKVVGLAHWLVSGPAPMTSDPLDFFSARAALLGSAGADEVEISDVDLAFREILSKSSMFDRIEFWADPSCNAQLQLVQFLDWVRPNSDVAGKLALFQANLPVGCRTPEEIASLEPSFSKVGEAELDAATQAWRAYRQPTPEAWFSLFDADLASLPRLSETVLRLLQELPAADTALSGTQLQLLNVIAAGERQPWQVLRKLVQCYQRPVYSYWHFGRMLDNLARCDVPAIAGLTEGPFDMALHDDKARFERYRRSSLELTDLGKALVRGEDDFSYHNAIDSWWGGTRLSNDRLWRWDDFGTQLVHPAQDWGKRHE